MKIEINSVEIKDEQLRAIVSITQEVGRFDGYRIAAKIEETLVSEIARQMLLERGPEIINSITNNQIINAVIMRVAGALSPGDR